MKKNKIETPYGKEAKWVNGMLTYVDRDPQDIEERNKAFEDALNRCKERKNSKL